MDIQEILDIVEACFDENVEAEGWADFGTPMADLVGRREFLLAVEEKLVELDKE